MASSFAILHLGLQKERWTQKGVVSRHGTGLRVSGLALSVEGFSVWGLEVLEVT